MKPIALVTLLFVSAAAHATTTVNDLTLSCEGTAKVVSTSNPHYSPARPPHGRAPGIGAAAGFQAVIEVTKLSSGCAPLATKYGVQLLDKSLKAQAGITPPLSLPDTSKDAHLAIGQEFAFVLHQGFGYVYNQKYLPLFPQTHEESLTLSGSFGNIEVSADVDFSIETAYGIPPISKLNDAQKTALAGHALSLAVQQPAEFQDLALQLEPQSPAAKRTYALLLVKYFAEVAQANPFTQFFEFHVGGTGSQVGEPAAAKLNSLSQEGALTPAEIEKLALAYPTLLLAGSQPSECLALKPAQLEEVLSTLLDETPSLTAHQKFLLQDPLSQLSGNVHYALADCFDENTSPKAKTLAQELLSAISQQN
jgi:hypothetical protein